MSPTTPVPNLGLSHGVLISFSGMEFYSDLQCALDSPFDSFSIPSTPFLFPPSCSGKSIGDSGVIALSRALAGCTALLTLWLRS